MTASNDQSQPDASTERSGAQPEYGQVNQPEYGAMASQYPAGYDPYVDGRPEAERSEPAPENGPSGPQAMPDRGPAEPYAPNGLYGPGDSFGHPPYAPPAAGGPETGERGPQPFHGIDMDDPRQNPLYGHWDFYAILSLVFALLMPVPVLPAVMGGVAMWRTRNFRMKGYGLALAAVIINALYTVATIWLMINGLSAMDLYQQLLGGMVDQGGGDGTTSIHA